MPTIASELPHFLDDLERRVQLRPATLRAYRGDLLAAAALLPGELTSITARAIEQTVADGDPERATVARRMSSLKRFFAWCVRHDLCPTNPVERCEPVKTGHGTPRPIAAADRLLLQKAFDDLPEPFRTVFWMLRETGMRAGEALALRLADVDLAPSRERLYIREAKNGRPRPVHVGDRFTPKTIRRIRKLLKDRADEPTHAPLFRSNRGSQLTYGALLYQWTKLCHTLGLIDAAGEPRYTIHQLRHTRGSELVEQGYTLDIVQSILGHRDPRSTQVYAELHADQVRAALER
jgi:integrase/recombinase XerD